MKARFPAKLARATKQQRGRTQLEATPVAIRSSIPLTPTIEKRIRRKLARHVGHSAGLIERGTVRFTDINGPRGGVDKECRIKLVLSGRPSVQASDRASEVEPAFERACRKVESALGHARGKHGLRSPRRRTPGPARARTGVAAPARSGALDRTPMVLETARRPPSRKAIKTKARRAKRRVGVQRAKG